jgi:hypothetical protein
LVQDFFGEGTDEGFAAELAVVVILSALDDVVDMEGGFGSQEYVIYDIHIRLTLDTGLGWWALFSAAEGA